MSKKPNILVDNIKSELLSIESLLVGRLYLYTLFHNVFGGMPDTQLLKLISSGTTIDVLDEYSDDETIAKLKYFLAQRCDKVKDEHYLDNIRAEYMSFFQGPTNLFAYPWEAPYITNDATIFQRSTLAIRDAYHTYGLQVKKYKSVPDDHISLMCAFLAFLAQRSVDAFRAGHMDELVKLMADQYRFVCDHMNNWLDKYSKLACKATSAYFYPQLIKGVEVFALLDENFIAQVLAWVENLSEDVVALLMESQCERPSEFTEVKEVIKEFKNLVLIGLDENELVAIL